MVVRFLTGGRRRPTKAQRELVEGDEPVASEHRVFLTCPDGDALAALLDGPLSDTGWPGELVVLKCHRELHDPEAEEHVHERRGEERI